LIEDYSPSVTFEGDNTVMLQQSSNYLFKLASKVMKKGVKAEGVFSYINELDTLTSQNCAATDYLYFLDIENIELALKVNVAMKLKQIMKKKESSKASKKDFINSIHSLEIVKVSQAHIKLMSFLFFKKGLSKLKCAVNIQNLTNLCMLGGLCQLMGDSTSCYEAKFFNENSSDFILEAVTHINRELRPYAINIIETVNVPDVVLSSAIGNSYGDIYETHLEWAKNSSLNHTKLGDAIPDGYIEYMMPVLKGKM
jgi:acyl-CoA oxidase